MKSGLPSNFFLKKTIYRKTIELWLKTRMNVSKKILFRIFVRGKFLDSTDSIHQWILYIHNFETFILAFNENSIVLGFYKRLNWAVMATDLSNPQCGIKGC